MTKQEILDVFKERIEGEKIILKTEGEQRWLISIDDFLKKFDGAKLDYDELISHPSTTEAWQEMINNLFKS